MEVHLVAILSIKLFEDTQEIMNKILSDKITLDFPIFDSSYPSIIIDNSFVNSLSDNEKKYFKRIDKRKDQVPMIIISTFNLPPFSEEELTELGDGPVNIDSKEYVNFNEFIAERTFRKRIIDLILSINLSYCGGINILEGKLFRYGKKVNDFGTIYNDLDLVKELSAKIGWPKLSNLQIEKTFNWLMNYKNSLDNISDSRIGRAVNAFTYLFHTSIIFENDLNDLLWSLIGLETIYTDGNTDLQNQLDYKSQLILGERQEFKKIIKNMYDYRSRYLHGKLNFASQFSSKDTTDFFDKFYPDLHEATNTAIGTFVASLQYFVLNDITDINFLRTYNYEITTSKSKTK